MLHRHQHTCLFHPTGPILAAEKFHWLPPLLVVSLSLSPGSSPLLRLPRTAAAEARFVYSQVPFWQRPSSSPPRAAAAAWVERSRKSWSTDRSIIISHSKSLFRERERESQCNSPNNDFLTAVQSRLHLKKRGESLNIVNVSNSANKKFPKIVAPSLVRSYNERSKSEDSALRPLGYWHVAVSQ